jgi:hypothetical protein
MSAGNTTFQDFDMLITPSGDGFQARILRSPGGEATGQFSLPFSELELGELLMRFRPPKGRPEEADAARKFGAKLFETIFTGEMLARYASSLDSVRRSDQGLRIRLRLTETPTLADLPWEYLYHAVNDDYVVLSANTPIVRYLEMPQQIEALELSDTLRILVMIASPSDYPALDANKEWERLNSALKPLVDKGTARVDRLPAATLPALQEHLRKSNYHMFHFIGHGEFEASGGALVLEGDDGKAHVVGGDKLGRLLHDYDSLRVAVLNACEGGRTSKKDVFGGVAQHFVRRGIPAVIANQFPVSDSAAIILAQEFYGALADGLPVDSALGEARKAIFTRINGIEWGTPVLYMRSPDGYIFRKQGAGNLMSDEKPNKAGVNVNINVGRDAKGLNIAGRDISTVNSTTGGIDPFKKTMKAIDDAPLAAVEKEDAADILKKLEAQGETDEPEQDRVDYYLEKLEKLAPDVVEVLINAVTNPGAAVGKGLSVAIKAWREARKSQ